MNLRNLKKAWNAIARQIQISAEYGPRALSGKGDGCEVMPVFEGRQVYNLKQAVRPLIFDQGKVPVWLSSRCREHLKQMGKEVAQKDGVSVTAAWFEHFFPGENIFDHFGECGLGFVIQPYLSSEKQEIAATTERIKSALNLIHVAMVSKPGEKAWWDEKATLFEFEESWPKAAKGVSFSPDEGWSAKS